MIFDGQNSCDLTTLTISGVQIPKSGFANTVFNTIFCQIVFGFGLYLCNLGYWIYICLDLDLKVFGLNLMNQLNWIASVYYQF